MGYLVVSAARDGDDRLWADGYPFAVVRYRFRIPGLQAQARDQKSFICEQCKADAMDEWGCVHMQVRLRIPTRDLGGYAIFLRPMLSPGAPGMRCGISSVTLGAAMNSAKGNNPSGPSF